MKRKNVEISFLQFIKKTIDINCKKNFSQTFPKGISFEEFSGILIVLSIKDKFISKNK